MFLVLKTYICIWGFSTIVVFLFLALETSERQCSELNNFKLKKDVSFFIDDQIKVSRESAYLKLDAHITKAVSLPT